MRQLPPLATSAEMAVWDAESIRFGISENMLMENAGHAIHSAILDNFALPAGSGMAIFTGPGNNGGDGFCVARLLQDSGARPLVFAFRPPEQLKGAAAYHADLAKRAGVPILPLSASTQSDCIARFMRKFSDPPALIIDALLGTGLKRDLSPALKDLIDCVNALAKWLRVPVVSIDVPSGLNSETGLSMPVAVRANLTVTLAAAKAGLVLPEARKYCGRILRRQIGIPECIQASHPVLWRLLDAGCLSEIGPLPENSFKNMFGHVAIIGGASGYGGAAHLAAAGALRAGAGLVTVLAPAACLPEIKSGWPEIMTRPLGKGDGWESSALPDLSFANCIVIGPGLTRTEAAAQILEAVLANPGRPPCVIDADALVLLSEHEELLAKLTQMDILTPHPGEAAALLRCAGRDIQADREKTLAELCAKVLATIVLKGAATLVGQGENLRLLCPYDIPDLAIGGAGDVLSGCIGALACPGRLAEFVPPAGIGVALHALAALRLSADYPQRGFTASQLADALPHAWRIPPPPDPGLTPWPSQP